MSNTNLQNAKSSFGGTSKRDEVMRQAVGVATQAGSGGGLAVPKLRSLICPFCGELTADSGRCEKCSARFDPLSRQASQNEMGPWSVRDEVQPHRPGCSYNTIKKLIEQGAIQPNSVIRGPSTRQFWMLAKHTPGVAQLFGLCHHCGAQTDPRGVVCDSCHESFAVDRDRQHLGLGLTRPLPGRTHPEILALRAEPAAGAERISGPAIVPEPVDGISRRADASGGLGGGGHGGVNDESGGAAELDAIHQIDELSRAVRSLRRAWISERKRAWISVICAGVVCAFALAIVLLS